MRSEALAQSAALVFFSIPYSLFPTALFSLVRLNGECVITLTLFAPLPPFNHSSFPIAYCLFFALRSFMYSS